MTTTLRTNLLWAAVLVGAGFALGLSFLCIAPIVAVATVAVRSLPLRIAVATVALTWFAGQVAGFALFHYPHAPATYALGVAILVAALAAAFTAGRVAALPLAFLAAFAVYEGVQYLFSLAFGGSDTFTFAIVAEMLEGNLFGLVLLGALRLVMRAAGDGARRIARR